MAVVGAVSCEAEGDVDRRVGFIDSRVGYDVSSGVVG